MQVKLCPYLDTINRKLLDFDFEKLCSVSLSNLNVYACLVCGKYYQGRGKNSHAYMHSLEQDHRVFINLQTEKIYCLPDGYQVGEPSVPQCDVALLSHTSQPRLNVLAPLIVCVLVCLCVCACVCLCGCVCVRVRACTQVLDPSLEDIGYNLHPVFTPAMVSKLDRISHKVIGVDGAEFLPGVKGLNNIKLNDWLNVCVQALVRIPMLRDFFLFQKNYENCKSLLVHSFGELVRKMWNPRSFRGRAKPRERRPHIRTHAQRT